MRILTEETNAEVTKEAVDAILKFAEKTLLRQTCWLSALTNSKP
jgi:hypothetical protein